MKLFKPQVQIFRRRMWEQPDEFFLHAVTFCPRTPFKANGYSIDKEENVIRVSLQIIKDPAAPDFEYLTPIVHTISLGSFEDQSDEGEIDVAVVIESPVLSRGGNEPPKSESTPAAQTTVKSTSADEDSRPVLDL